MLAPAQEPAKGQAADVGQPQIVAQHEQAHAYSSARDSQWSTVLQGVNFFDPRVFDWKFYLKKYPLLAASQVNNQRRAKQNWVDYGIREGRRGSPTFSAKIYLMKNPDVAKTFGADNYPYAIAHFLKHYDTDAYRATGGPLRINLFDPRVFDWRWYLEHNPLLRRIGFTTEQQARQHW